MNDEYELEYSGRCGPLERDGRSVRVEIYRGKDQEEKSWILEIIDNVSGSSVVWDDQFETDEAAYEHLMKEIEQLGLGKVIDGAPEAQLPH